MGADSPAILFAIAMFYALLHSGFEEFYWRGFVFRGLNEHLGVALSVCISSLAFMSHHHRSGNLIPGWISHALVDAAIFIIGYQLVFS